MIDPKAVKVTFAEAFDTYKSSKSFDEFILKGLPLGSVVVAACKDDCVTSLSVKAKNWFRNMGSQEIQILDYRQSFSFIGITGKKQAVNEQRAPNLGDQASVTQIFGLKEDSSAIDPDNGSLGNSLKGSSQPGTGFLSYIYKGI